MSAANYASTTNACRPCMPMGACLAFKGVEGGVPFLHGSQGCATYMRRYLISHYREPVDIASSALGEKHAIYGGGPNLKKGLLNVMKKYGAKMIGVCSTCLTETIGDDLRHLLREFHNEFGDLDLPAIVQVPTPSFAGSHSEGWHAAAAAMVEQLASDEAGPGPDLGLFPPLLSPGDMRILSGICKDFGLNATLLPDIGETLDGPALIDYERIPSGGAPVQAIRRLGRARAGVQLGHGLPRITAAGVLADRFNIPTYAPGLPLGLTRSDALFKILEELSGRPTPRQHELERGRLIDAYVDGHKYVFGRRVVVYGEEDLVVGLTAFLSEIGCNVVLAATGGAAKSFEAEVREAASLGNFTPEVLTDVDFETIATHARELEPELMIGHSKGYRYAREWNIPLVRVGFPVHDRFGAQRIHTLGYRGAQELFDRVVNAILEHRQNASHIGYGYL